MINNKRSYTEYNITSPTTDFAIGFENYGVGAKDIIEVTLNGVLVESLGHTVRLKNAQVLEVTPAIEAGTVRLQRVTGIDSSFHKFTAGALFTAKSMDENFEQIRHSQQEVKDGFLQAVLKQAAQFSEYKQIITAQVNTSLTAVNQAVQAFSGRVGALEGSVTGIIRDLYQFGDKAAQYTKDAVKTAITDAQVNIGFITIDSFELGATITQRNQALRHETDGKLYRWAGDLPKTIPESSTPASSGGVGTNTWLEVSDTVLRQELAQAGGAAIIRDKNGVTQQKVNDSLKLGESILNHTSTGELTDGLVSALAISNNIVLSDKPDGYTVSKYVSIELTQENTVIDFNNQPVNFTGSVQLKAPVVLTTAVTTPIPRYATELTLDSTIGVQPGDLLYLSTDIAVETQWNYKKQDCVKIKSITGNVVQIEEPVQFSYDVADAGLTVTVYKARKVTLINPNFSLDAVAGVGMFDLMGLQSIVIESPKAQGSSVSWNAATNELRRMFRLSRCYGVTVNNANFTRLSYPILVADGTRNTTVNGVTGNDCRHLIEATSWAKNLTINNLIGSDNYASISAHPAFDIHYDGVKVERDRMPPNLRCVRGSLKNVTMHTLADNTIISGSYYQSLLLSPDLAYLWDDADFTFDDVKIQAPNRTIASLGIYYGRNVYVTNCTDVDFSAPIKNGLTGSVIFGSGNSFKRGQTPSIGLNNIRNTVQVATNPLRNAKLIDGIYDVNLRENIVDQDGSFLRCYGKILTNSIGDKNITLRIHDNCFADIDNVSNVVFNLKLKASLSHSNLGGFAYQEKWFSFRHQAAATSYVSQTITPTYVSALQGVSNETLDVSITELTQVGVTEVGASKDFYVDITIALASGRTSPLHSLSYELELNAV